jgi:hypothetical protein
VAEAKRYLNEAIGVVTELGVSHSNFRTSAWLGFGPVAPVERDFTLAQVRLAEEGLAMDSALS